MQGVKRKDSAGSPEDTVGMWYNVYDSTGKISDIWFLRQLTEDELQRKVGGGCACLPEFCPCPDCPRLLTHPG